MKCHNSSQNFDSQMETIVFVNKYYSCIIAANDSVIIKSIETIYRNVINIKVELNVTDSTIIH